ncbi:helix-turn-helix domain-containing protein [Ruminiclostridium cellobioparum]|uniref:helix-turn-helix domain-containing protein n=3 Tax=Ruminiclostridium cellobioparum TaxID=29355 RepID=UPI000486133A|nr:helix-turn-helix domain-containing protein [Ruminiclostridium cellobioparum]
MAFKHKYSYAEKEKIIIEYLNNTYGFRELCRIYEMSQGALKGWIRLYNAFGFEGLRTSSQASRYSSVLKQSAVNDYLNGKYTAPEILKKYKIRSETQLRRWIKKYNGHEELKSFGTEVNTIMTKGRKTTFDERVEIVEYCIAHDHNYAETGKKYQVSYQQARNYAVKYESGGVETLKDNRGKRKSEDEMSELEKLRAENKILRAEKECAEMEVSFLKKLEEIERRRG